MMVVLLVLVAVVVIIVVSFNLMLKSEEKRRRGNARLRKEILAHGIKAEATVVNAKVFGEAHNGDTRALVAGKFSIKILDTGEEFVYRRRELAVPLAHVGDLKYNSVIPVFVHKDDRSLVLFEFDRVGAALGITLRDP